MAGSRRKRSAWVQFPYKDTAYEYPGPALKKAWPKLHRGDCEPWPDAARIEALYARFPALRALSPPRLDAAALAGRLADAWRAFHAGEFAEAWQQGAALGGLGALVAAKAAGVYGTYLARDADAVAVLEAAVALSAPLARAAPGVANAHYFHAFVLGRLSQRVSVLKALAAGHAGQVRASLDTTLSLEPRHGDAHIALGVFHTEIVAKLGALPARLSYGASAAAAQTHFEAALKLNPKSAIARLEYARSLVALAGRAGASQAAKLRAAAAAVSPVDAMERLDVESAQAGRG